MRTKTHTTTTITWQRVAWVVAAAEVLIHPLRQAAGAAYPAAADRACPVAAECRWAACDVAAAGRSLCAAACPWAAWAVGARAWWWPWAVAGAAAAGRQRWCPVARPPVALVAAPAALAPVSAHPAASAASPSVSSSPPRAPCACRLRFDRPSGRRTAGKTATQK